MGMFYTLIKKADLKKQNILQIYPGEDRPYLLINTYRCDFILIGKRLWVQSRDFTRTTDKKCINSMKRYWRKLHKLPEYAGLKRIYYVAPEQLAKEDCDAYSSFVEVSEEKFKKILELRKVE